MRLYPKYKNQKYIFAKKNLKIKSENLEIFSCNNCVVGEALILYNCWFR